MQAILQTRIPLVLLGKVYSGGRWTGEVSSVQRESVVIYNGEVREGVNTDYRVLLIFNII